MLGSSGITNRFDNKLRLLREQIDESVREWMSSSLNKNFCEKTNHYTKGNSALQDSIGIRCLNASVEKVLSAPGPNQHTSTILFRMQRIVAMSVNIMLLEISIH